MNATQQQNVRVFLEGQGQKVSTSFTNLVVRERAFRLGEAVAALGVLELAGRLPELKPVCASVRDGAPDDDEMTEDDRRAWDLLLETHGGCCVVSFLTELGVSGHALACSLQRSVSMARKRNHVLLKIFQYCSRRAVTRTTGVLPL